VVRAAKPAAALDADASGIALAQKAVQLIAGHARTPISTASVAAALDCNPNYLSRIFHKVHGHTLTEAIHRRRIYEAKLLLIEEPLTVEQVARTCGFGSAKYMGLLFHRYVGMSPLAYRQQFTIPASSIVTILKASQKECLAATNEKLSPPAPLPSRRVLRAGEGSIF